MPHNELVARVPLAPFGQSSNPRAGLTGEARQPLDIDAARMAEILQNATEFELSTLEADPRLAPFVSVERTRRGAEQFPSPPPAAPRSIAPGAQAAGPTGQRQLNFRMSPEPAVGAPPVLPTPPVGPTQPSVRPPNVMPPHQGPSPQPQVLGALSAPSAPAAPTQPQAPASIGAAAQLQQLPIQPSPPRDEADLQQRTQGWQSYFSSPEVQAALLQFAIAFGQPVPPGQTTFGHGLQAVGAGAQAAGRVTTAQQKQAAAEQERELERRRVVVAERGEKAAGRFVTLTPEQKTSLGINKDFLAQLNTATGQITTKNQSGATGTLKAVLDQAATKAAGKPVTRFATADEIQRSEGNLTPVPSGISLRTTDEGVEFTTGGLGLPAAVESRTLQRITAGSELLTNVGTLLDQVEEGGASVVGPLGAFKGFINVTAASFVPAMFSGDRALFERQLKITREASKRAVSDEERFTDADRLFVQELFPTPGLFGNPQTADAKLQVMAAFFVRRLGPDLEAVGINAAQVPTLSLRDLLFLGGSGLLTASEVRKAAEFLFPARPLDLDSVLKELVASGRSTEEMESVVRQLFPGSLQ